MSESRGGRATRKRVVEKSEYGVGTQDEAATVDEAVQSGLRARHAKVARAFMKA